MKDKIDSEFDRKLIIRDALEVKILNLNDYDESFEFPIRFEVTDYSEEEMTLQFNFDDLESLSSQYNENFDTIMITFWGTKYFKDKA